MTRRQRKLIAYLVAWRAVIYGIYEKRTDLTEAEIVTRCILWVQRQRYQNQGKLL